MTLPKVIQLEGDSEIAFRRGLAFREIAIASEEEAQSTAPEPLNVIPFPRKK